MATTAHCAGCTRRVVLRDTPTADVSALVAWEQDGNGSWWCTECQSRLGRTPLLTWRSYLAADPHSSRRRRLATETERWARIDTVLVWAALLVLAATVVVAVVLASG